MRLPSAVLAVARWLLGLVAPAAALGLTLLLQPLLDQAPSPPFGAAVLVVAWLGGFGPALLATAVSTVALDYYFLAPAQSLSVTPGDLVWLVLFAAVSVGTAWLVASRGRARTRLASSEQQLRLVTDTAPQLICYVDTNRRFRFANRPYAERYGRTPADLVGRRVAEVLGTEGFASIRRPLAEALAGRRVVAEITQPAADGARVFQATYLPDLAATGRSRGVVMVVDDVTDRKRTDDERVRLLTLEQARRREAEAIAELGRILTEGLDLDTVAQRIAELSRGLLRASATTVYRVEPVSRDFVCLAVSGDLGPLSPGDVLPRGTGAVGLAVEYGHPVTTTDVLGDPQIDASSPGSRALVESASFRAVLAVPLRVKGRIIGAFAVGDHLGRTFTPDELRLAEAMADHAAAALENARLYTEAGDRWREAELLGELARAVNASLDLDTVLGRVTAAARELCDAGLARIALRESGGEAMVFRYAAGPGSDAPEPGPVTPGEGPAGEALAAGHAVRRGPVLVAPIRTGEGVEGLIYVDHRDARPFGEGDEAVLMRLADHAAVALRNARLFAGEQAARGGAEARARRTRLLADVSRVLASSPDYESTLDRVARLLVPAEADWCIVHLARRDGSVRRVVVAHADPAHAALAAEMRALPPTREHGDGAALQAARAGRSLLVADMKAERLEEIVTDAGDHRVLQALQPHSMLVVPLMARGRPLGVLTWLRIARPEPFTTDDLGLAEDVAARAAVAIDGARLYRRAERARVDAETANQAKDEFLAVLSHELRTPLTSMLGWLRLLRTGHLEPGRTAQALEVVERNTRTQAQLINDLLDVSRIVTGKLQLDIFPVELAPTVDEAVQSARGAAEAKGVALELTVAEAPGRVMGDPLRLGQIVSNLVANAIKFTAAGGQVRVGLGREGGEAVVTVADTGIGIAPEVLAHIFDRFRQADSTITRRHGGLGLGLAIARHLAELHAGHVAAESAGLGHGATFTLRLPLATGTAEPAAAVAVPDGAARLHGVRVLLVEDHRDTAELLRTVLGEQGAGVHVAGSLAEALATLAAREFDVLVSDIAMPDGTGYELMEHMRDGARATGRAPLPAVAVTAFVGGEDRARALAAGFVDYAAKPIEPAHLVDSVARAVARR